MGLHDEIDNRDDMPGKEHPDELSGGSFGKDGYDMTPNDVAIFRNYAPQETHTVEPEDHEALDGDGSVLGDGRDNATPQSFGDWRNAQAGMGNNAVFDREDVPVEGRFGYMAGDTATEPTLRTPEPVTPAVPHHDDARGQYPHANGIGSKASSPRVSYGGNTYEQHGTQKKGSHIPWLIGGIAAGAIVIGLGFSVANNLPDGNGVSIPDHTTQWEGTSEETATKTDGTASVTSGRNTGSENLTLASDVAERCLPSVVAIHVSDGASSGMGSGVIIDDEGHVLTNSHVVKDMQEIVVVSGNGEEYTAELLGLDDSSDLAVLNVEWGDADITPMEYGDSASLKVGEWVMTIGSPYGLDQSVSTGIVSALSRNQLMESYGGYRIYANLIQTDAAINLGNSGGALVNADGRLVGINSMLASSSGSYSAVGFAIPSNYAKRVADQIIAGKEVEHAYIGAQFGNVSRLSMMEQDGTHGTIIDESGQEVISKDGTPTTGAYVAGVVDDSPAKEAGLQEGDIITKFGNERISSASGIILAVRAHEIGETVPVTVWRDGKEVTLEVTLGSDAGKGLYDNDGSSSHQQPQSPYGGYDDEMEQLRRLFEQFGFSE